MEWKVLLLITIVTQGLASATPSRFPNVGYLGSTYNIFKGNPESTKGLDPGFTLRNVYSLTYEKGQVTGDGRYSIPDFTHITSSSVCSFNFDSSTTQDTSSYTNSLQVHVDADFKGWGASFSASTDYNDVHSGTTSSQKIFVSSDATCESYIAFIQPLSRNRKTMNATTPNLNPAFQKDVYYLPAKGDNDTYFNFIHKWGTHYAYSLRMGGRYGVRSSFLSSDYIEMSASGLDVSAAAGYSGAFSINSNLTTDAQQNQSRQYEQQRKDYQMYQIGGTPYVSQGSEEPYFQWAQTVKDNPLPIKYSLLPLSNVLIAQNFPDDKNIAVKQANLQEITKEYCLSMLDIDIRLCTNASTNGGAFPVTTVSDYDSFEIYSSVIPGDFNINVGIQKVDSTNTFIMGVLLQFSTQPVIPTVIINNPGTSNDLVKAATSWEDSLCTTDGACFIRPICPEGYSSISDFYCTDSSSKDACLSTIPRNLPCIADHCLTQCRPHFPAMMLEGTLQITLNGTVFDLPLVINGNKYLGSGSILPGNFFRYMKEDSEIDQSLFKCLGYNCLSFQ